MLCSHQSSFSLITLGLSEFSNQFFSFLIIALHGTFLENNAKLLKPYHLLLSIYIYTYPYLSIYRHLTKISHQLNLNLKTREPLHTVPILLCLTYILLNLAFKKNHFLKSLFFFPNFSLSYQSAFFFPHPFVKHYVNLSIWKYCIKMCYITVYNCTIGVYLQPISKRQVCCLRLCFVQYMSSK